MPMFPYDTQRMCEVLKKARKQCNMTQTKAASLIGMGQSTLSAIESGKRPLRAEEFIMMASVLHYDIACLLEAAEPGATLHKIEHLLREHTTLTATGVDAVMIVIRLLIEKGE